MNAIRKSIALMLKVLVSIVKVLDGNKPTAKKYRLVFSLGLVSACVVFLYLFSIDKNQFLTTINNSTHQQLTLISILVLVLRFTTGILGMLVILGALLEITDLSIDYKKHALSLPISAPFISILFGAAIAFLIYISTNILMYLMIYFLYLIFDILNVVFVSHQVNRKIQSISKNTAVIPDTIDKLHLYYVRRHRVLLGMFRVVLVVLAIVLAIASRILGSYAYEVTAYILIISVILLNEGFTWFWRWQLYRKTWFYSHENTKK